jgi:hypothetical protein
LLHSNSARIKLTLVCPLGAATESPRFSTRHLLREIEVQLLFVACGKKYQALPLKLVTGIKSTSTMIEAFFKELDLSKVKCLFYD